MASACQLYGKKTSHRKKVNCLVIPSKPHTSVCTPPPLYVLDTSRVTVPPLVPKVSVCKRVSLWVGHLRGRLSFSESSFPPGWLESSLFFHSQMWGILFPAPVLQAGEPGMGGLGPSFLNGGNLSTLDNPLILNHHMEVWVPIRRFRPSYQSWLGFFIFLVMEFCWDRLQVVLQIDCSIT